MNTLKHPEGHKAMNTVVIKSSKLARLSSVLALATAAMLALPGCTTIVATFTPDHSVSEGIVYRMSVTDKAGYLDKNDYEMAKAGLRNFTRNYPYFNIYGGRSTPDQTVPYRFTVFTSNGAWEGTTLFNGGAATGSEGSFVDDSVPLLKKGDLVDVYSQANPSMKDRRYFTIVRLVCMAEDKACAEREKGNWKKPLGWIVQPRGRFDERRLSVTPHMDLNGDWLPGKEPKRPPLPAGATAAASKAGGWGD